MFYSFVIVCVLGGPCPLRVEDEIGPYKTAEECWLRGSTIIKDVASRFPLVTLQSVCSTKSPGLIFKKEKDKGKSGPDNSVLAPDPSSHRNNCSSSKTECFGTGAA